MKTSRGTGFSGRDRPPRSTRAPIRGCRCPRLCICSRELALRCWRVYRVSVRCVNLKLKATGKACRAAAAPRRRASRRSLLIRYSSDARPRKRELKSRSRKRPANVELASAGKTLGRRNPWQLFAPQLCLNEIIRADIAKESSSSIDTMAQYSFMLLALAQTTALKVFGTPGRGPAIQRASTRPTTP